jgi:CRISPR-associated protein (TIGR02710 family)
MKKSLIVTTGIGSTVEDGIFFSIKKQNPTHVCFIATKESTSTIEKIKEKCRNAGMELTFEEQRVSNENDVDKIYAECIALIDRLLKSGFRKDQIAADYTGGTKAMSAGLVLAAVDREIEGISYVYGDRNQEGRVISGSERLTTLSPQLPLEAKVIEKAVLLFNQYQYAACRSVLEPYRFPSQERRRRVDALITLSHAFEHWDKFDLGKAKEHLSKLDEETAKEMNIKDKVEKLRQWLYKAHKKEKTLDTDGASQLWAIDIFCNAKRRAKEGKYDDAVARLYRVLEMMLQIEYLRIFGEETKVGLVETLEKLSGRDSDSAVLKRFAAKRQELLKLLSMRNSSILAHGLEPITKEKYDKCEALVRDILQPEQEVAFIQLKPEVF